MYMKYNEQFSILKYFLLIFQTAIVLLKSDSTEAFDKNNKHCPYKFEKWKEKKHGKNN